MQSENKQSLRNIKVNEIDIYLSIRSEIMQNHALMHWFSIIVMLVVLIGTCWVENRLSILSIFLPILSVAWAAAIIRFDFFIHRQINYLQTIESEMHQKGISIPLWESWKSSLMSTNIVVPITDLIICTVIVIPTIYVLFKPAQDYFQTQHWKGGLAYAIGASVLLLFLLLSLAFVPKFAKI